jgi:hypothetical protein
MCESCGSGSLNRREFIAVTSAIGAIGMIPASLMGAADPSPVMTRTPKPPARVKVVFLYPPADVVNAGKNEDNWAPNHWFTWPGNQFQPEEQEQTFTREIKEIARRIGLDVNFAAKPLYQEAVIKQFIAETKSSNFDAVLVINFWNTFSKWSYQIATESAPTAIVYQPVGSSHQLPLENLRKGEGFFYIHSVENWDEIERGLRAVHAKKRLSQSRMLRVSGNPQSQFTEQYLGIDVVSAPAQEFNAIFDAFKPDNQLVKQSQAFKRQASRVMDVSDYYFQEAMRSHRAVKQMLAQYEADAITIECLMLEHRKPCVSFSLNNSELIPCGCENDFNATLTLMLGQRLFERAGFQHNPDFDTSRNAYFASHCTCALKLKGPQGPSQKYVVRPFFHQLPPSAAVDVQWTPGEPVTLLKYLSEKNTVACWTGKVIESPTCPPVGGCATRVLVDIDKVQDVCDVYPGPHPALFCADAGTARRIKVFSKMYNIGFSGNL